MKRIVYGLIQEGHPIAPVLQKLAPQNTEIFIGSSLEHFANSPPPEILTVYQVPQGGQPLLEFRKVFEFHQSSLKWVHSLLAGVEHLLYPGINESTIPMTNSKGSYALPLNEFAIAGCLYFARQIPLANLQKQQKLWQGFVTSNLFGKTMTVCGYGDIGMNTAKLAKAFGMHVIGVSRSGVQKEYADEVITFDTLVEVAARTDYMVCAIPNAQGTSNLVNAHVINNLPSHAVFINLGRGHTIDENALLNALKNKQIQGAALDVFQQEPLPEESPFWDLENVLMTPHCADIDDDTWDRVVGTFVRLYTEYEQGALKSNLVDKAAGY